MLTQEVHCSPWVCVMLSYADLHPKLGKLQLVLVVWATQEVLYMIENLRCLRSESGSCESWSEKYLEP